MHLYKYITTCLLLVAATIQTYGQQQVHLRTISVLQSDKIQLFWEPPTNPQGFDSLQIFAKTGNQFDQISSYNNLTALSYIHTYSATKSIPYFIKTWYGGASHNSDTLASIYVSASSFEGVETSVEWNILSDNIATGYSQFTVERQQMGSSVWELATTTEETSFSETLSICIDGLRYRVSQSYGDSLSFSNISTPLSDQENPESARLDSVSITTDGHPVLGWQRSPSSDVATYRIHIYNNGWELYTDINNPDSTWFIDTGFDACSGVRSYRMATADRCGNATFADVGEVQHNMLLEEPQNSPCDESVTLKFISAYENLYPQMGTYKIYVSQDGAPFTFLDNWSPFETTYTHQNVDRNSTYTYQITVENSEETSTARACQKTVVSNQPLRPTFGFIKNVSVDTTFVEINVALDTLIPNSCFYLYRAIENPQTELNFLPKDTLCQTLIAPNFRFWDSLTNTREYIYHYRLKTVDSCGREYLAPTDAQNILAEAEGNSGESITVSWNSYTGFVDGVKEYLLFRGINGIWDEFPISAPYESATEYIDTDSEAIQNLSTTQYRIAAISDAPNIFEDVDTAWSNITSVSQIFSQVWIPNVFRPWGSENTEFKPVFDKISSERYSMVIYSKWGDVVFESSDPYVGWKGYFNGKKAPCQVYAYIISYVTKNGNARQETGAVMLLD